MFLGWLGLVVLGGWLVGVVDLGVRGGVRGHLAGQVAKSGQAVAKPDQIGAEP